jgi:alpha-glucosidase (family GH31 glycosyl hydrolase)
MLYDDDGETFNYEKGEYSWREIKVQKDRSGKHKGTISAPVKNKPNTVGNITWKFMTAK